ncbi:MAG: UDP-N-acetylglucosamine 1-carboxyvinyltransferase [Gracilimonas sp.]|uniref:UDP-N-acetylglucosamine 1-carboxyvinyltransferase n=1 Tax=Gracilimonas TaxID=649462 RepID=UPI001B251CE7|nr:UDP-N-acetylglucosamine 1-carboxyvinyltransferase [Gracilimonas sp.]MBO6586084.1 UDP-N-acetylglucosamine 1-carboxyvinyltransferase [Gracilimonas sp.]MBO6614741.1 UDP-N-acetylglucosamine 1-carboxyvinyltransferase [Gracilimonas sp.]
MDKFIIEGGTPLKGTIPISGSKNAALPLMAASLLGNSASTIRNTPRLKDIYTFNNVIRVVGAQVDFKEDENTLVIDPSNVNHLEAPYDLVRKMRASFYMLGALVGKHGYAKVSMPGGCAWGPRPVDLHLKGMEAMGIDIELEKGYVIAKADDKIEGGTFRLEPSSVGATVNLLLAAVLKAKKFTIENAAKEPDVVQLCNFLTKMGADIEGIGTDTLTVKAVDSLEGIDVSNDPDRIELGTFMIAGAMYPGSELTLTGCNPDQLGGFTDKLRKTGTSVEVDGTTIHVKAPDKLKPVSIKTEIYPGFPTDLQAQWATMMTQAEGDSKVTDTVYFDRFSYVPELTRLGADMEVEKNTVHISGKTPLTGASVMSTDLRASVSLVLAAMVAENHTEVLRIYHLDRGYESLEDKLSAVGASIKRVDGD